MNAPTAQTLHLPLVPLGLSISAWRSAASSFPRIHFKLGARPLLTRDLASSQTRTWMCPCARPGYSLRPRKRKPDRFRGMRLPRWHQYSYRARVLRFATTLITRPAGQWPCS